MHLSDLQTKDIVSVSDGKKIGNIVDVIIDDNGNMESLIVQRSKIFNNLFNGNSEIEVKWKQISKIGEDVILINLDL